jgi:hypothetical protein
MKRLMLALMLLCLSSLAFGTAPNVNPLSYAHQHIALRDVPERVAGRFPGADRA